jgi:multidrug resistance efflux pump
VAGREVEIVELAQEGARVKPGDLLVRFDDTEVQRELERARQDFRQSQMDLDVADSELDDAQATVRAVAEGEGALTVEEARTRLQLAERKAERLRHEYGQLRPLLDKGYITRDELAKTADQVEQADEELRLARKRTEVLLDLTHPRETKRASLQLAQKQAQRGRAGARVNDLAARVELLEQLLRECVVRAGGPGMVVYEEHFSSNPRRKVRVGDRVTASQGVITVSEVAHMLMDGSVSESQVHRIKSGQEARVRVEAFPDARLTGKVLGVGTLASASAFRPLEDKRFDLVLELEPSTVDLRPEMTARADVVVGTREAVLLVPVTAVFERQGAFVSYVRSGNGIETRQIDLGESNDVDVEVLAGLKEGDRLLLTPPRSAAPAAAIPESPGLPGSRTHATQFR